ncbi:hypothetical protein [Microbacterium rhizophilus]
MPETHSTESKPAIEETSGMRLAFWSWAIIVGGGLAVMITLPLMGR